MLPLPHHGNSFDWWRGAAELFNGLATSVTGAVSPFGKPFSVPVIARGLCHPTSLRAPRPLLLPGGPARFSPDNRCKRRFAARWRRQVGRVLSALPGCERLNGSRKVVVDINNGLPALISR